MAARNLFESATARCRVIRQGDLVCLVIDGGGAMVMLSRDFQQTQKWAQSKTASGNVLTDRGRLFDQVPALVSRPGTTVGTRGNQKQLEGLARLMRQGGYDLGEWVLPVELKQPPGSDPDPAQAKRPAAPEATDPAQAAPTVAPAVEPPRPPGPMIRKRSD